MWFAAPRLHTCSAAQLQGLAALLARSAVRCATRAVAIRCAPWVGRSTCAAVAEGALKNAPRWTATAFDASLDLTRGLPWGEIPLVAADVARFSAVVAARDRAAAEVGRETECEEHDGLTRFACAATRHTFPPYEIPLVPPQSHSPPQRCRRRCLGGRFRVHARHVLRGAVAKGRGSASRARERKRERERGSGDRTSCSCRGD